MSELATEITEEALDASAAEFAELLSDEFTDDDMAVFEVDLPQSAPTELTEDAKRADDVIAKALAVYERHGNIGANEPKGKFRAGAYLPFKRSLANGKMRPQGKLLTGAADRAGVTIQYQHRPDLLKTFIRVVSDTPRHPAVTTSSEVPAGSEWAE